MSNDMERERFDPSPCPFCGHAGTSDPRISFDCQGRYAMLVCGMCGARGPEVARSSPALESVEAWNRRATPAPAEAQAVERFHPDASHIPPDYRDGWNHCHDAWTRSAPPTAGAERTPTDFALEHAEYMASTAERLLQALNDEDEVRLRREESDDVDEDAVYDAGASRNEFQQHLRNRIYEFRKRRDRAAAPSAPSDQPEQQR